MKIILQKATKGSVNDSLLQIKKQYHDATKVKIEQITDRELADWLAERKKISERYLMLLAYMGIEYDHPMTAEIGKSFFDTAVYDKRTTLITPYTAWLNPRRTIKAEFKVTSQNEKGIETSPLRNIDCIMTQNPYRKENIKNWEELFNKFELTTAIGIYGNIFDKDAEEKIKMLEKIKKSLTCKYKIDGYRTNDEYAYAITSRRVYKKIKSK